MKTLVDCYGVGWGGLACSSNMTGNIKEAVNLVCCCVSARATGRNVGPDWEECLMTSLPFINSDFRPTGINDKGLKLIKG